MYKSLANHTTAIALRIYYFNKFKHRLNYLFDDVYKSRYEFVKSCTEELMEIYYKNTLTTLLIYFILLLLWVGLVGLLSEINPLYLGYMAFLTSTIINGLFVIYLFHINHG